MASTLQFVSENNLRSFKTNQDAYNLSKFASLSGGKVTAEQLPSYVDDIIEGYTRKNEHGAVTFYSDSDCTVSIAGETGKIYYDLNATIDGAYRYGGSAFVAVGNSVSTADKAVKDGSGNVITETYATKGEASAIATKSTAGVVIVGDNIAVASDGTISVSTATDSNTGLAQAGTNINVSNGVFSVNTGTNAQKGVVQAGDGIDVANGVISIAKAGTYVEPAQGEEDENVYGRVAVGANITNTNGVISLTDTNITAALGYTPLDAASISELSSAAIDAMFTVSGGTGE